MKNTFYYDLNEASEVVWDNVPKYVREKFSFEEVYRILETEQVLFDELGINILEGNPEPVLNVPVEIDWDKLKYDIIFRCAPKDIFLTYDEVDDILEAELVYYELN